MLGIPEHEIRELFQELAIVAFGYDRDAALATGGIRADTAKFGLFLGDRACLVTARQHLCTALTADRAWLDIGSDMVAVRLIR